MTWSTTSWCANGPSLLSTKAEAIVLVVVLEDDMSRRAAEDDGDLAAKCTFNIKDVAREVEATLLPPAQSDCVTRLS